MRRGTFGECMSKAVGATQRGQPNALARTGQSKKIPPPSFSSIKKMKKPLGAHVGKGYHASAYQVLPSLLHGGSVMLTSYLVHCPHSGCNWFGSVLPSEHQEQWREAMPT